MDYLNAKLLGYYKRGFERTGEIYLSLLQLIDMKVDRNRRIEHGAWHESHQIPCAGLHAEIIRRRLWLRNCQTISRFRGIDRRPFDFIVIIIAWSSPHVKWIYWFLTISRWSIAHMYFCWSTLAVVYGAKPCTVLWPLSWRISSESTPFWNNCVHMDLRIEWLVYLPTNPARLAIRDIICSIRFIPIGCGMNHLDWGDGRL